MTTTSAYEPEPSTTVTPCDRLEWLEDNIDLLKELGVTEIEIVRITFTLTDLENL